VPLSLKVTFEFILVMEFWNFFIYINLLGSTLNGGSTVRDVTIPNYRRTVCFSKSLWQKCEQK
jgi:hypothetical protein